MLKTLLKDFFKLMNNSVFGKTIENIRKRQNVILVDDRKLANKLSSKPNFDRVTIFDENLIALHMKKTEVYFNKPIYVCQAILDLSKTLLPNSLYRAACFENFEGILGISVPSIIKVGARLCKSQRNSLTRLRFLRDVRGNPSNRTRL